MVTRQSAGSFDSHSGPCESRVHNTLQPCTQAYLSDQMVSFTWQAASNSKSLSRLLHRFTCLATAPQLYEICLSCAPGLRNQQTIRPSA